MTHIDDVHNLIERVARRLIDNSAECLCDHGGLSGPITVREEDWSALNAALLLLDDFRHKEVRQGVHPSHDTMEDNR